MRTITGYPSLLHSYIRPDSATSAASTANCRTVLASASLARCLFYYSFFFSSRRRHTRCGRDWSSDVCSSDLRLAREVEKRNPKPAVFYLVLAEQLEARRHFDEAEKLYQKAMELRPMLPEPRNSLGLLHMRLGRDRKSTRLNSSHGRTSYAVFC